MPVQRDGEFMYANKTIGIYPRLIHVPTHFFKIVICKKGNSGYGKHAKNIGDVGDVGDNDVNRTDNNNTLHISVGAFLIPNIDIPMSNHDVSG